MSYKQTWIAMAGGAAAAAWGLSRRSYTGLAVAIGGGCVAYWAASGRWPNFPREASWNKLQELVTRPTGSSELPPLAGEPQTEMEAHRRQWFPGPNADIVEEASMDSFPASDPPSYMSSSASPSARPR